MKLSVFYRKTGISEAFEGHMGPITGIDCHNVPGQIDFSPYFLTSSFDWTLKLWSIKVRTLTLRDMIYLHVINMTYLTDMTNLISMTFSIDMTYFLTGPEVPALF